MENKSLKFLYNTFIGRLFLKVITRPFVSKIGGALLNTRASSIFIKGFIRKNNITIDDYEEKKYCSYNDFFTRKIKDGKRFVDSNPKSLVSPSDSNLLVYKIDNNSIFKVKNSLYKVEHLLNDKELANEYLDGYCLIFRLAVDNYHRYSYIDDGVILLRKKIKGIFHTVQKIAVEQYNVYGRNAREYMVLDTKHFGKVIQIEVGALMVGRISNNHDVGYHFSKGEEKGYFEFGGSTIILLIKKDAIVIDNNIINNSNNNIETMVKLGQKIGTEK